MKQEFAGKITISKNVYSGASGAFEVDIDGELIHSKLTMAGHGKCQTDQELDAVMEKITAKVG